MLCVQINAFKNAILKSKQSGRELESGADDAGDEDVDDNLGKKIKFRSSLAETEFESVKRVQAKKVLSIEEFEEKERNKMRDMQSRRKKKQLKRLATLKRRKVPKKSKDKEDEIEDW